jgi:hypothetical protein
MISTDNFKKLVRKYQYQLNSAKRVFKDQRFYETYKISKAEAGKLPSRSEIINYLLNSIQGTRYLEIGVRNPEDNFNKIKCKSKFSVDPGIEFKENPVDYKMTSDAFFKRIEDQTLFIPGGLNFDVIFIDGLHLANQVELDINNSLRIISDKGFIVVHDCNPPTEFHARESFGFKNSPARGFWNGTTWKAFYKFRHIEGLYSICFDSDWGVGIISKTKYPSFNNLGLPLENPYFEFNSHQVNKGFYMNLQNFTKWKETNILNS